MNKTLAILSLVGSFVLSTPVSAATNPAITMTDAEIAAKVALMVQQAGSTTGGGVIQVYTQSMRTEAQIQDVMKLNGITRDAAIIRINRSEASQRGFVPKPVISIFSAYDPSENAFRQPLPRNFYAGYDKTNKTEVFTSTKRLEVLPNFWYCGLGIKLLYSPTGSTCEK